jgi:hypothetical protein
MRLTPAIIAGGRRFKSYHPDCAYDDFLLQFMHQRECGSDLPRLAEGDVPSLLNQRRSMCPT